MVGGELKIDPTTMEAKKKCFIPTNVSNIKGFIGVA